MVAGYPAKSSSRHLTASSNTCCTTHMRYSETHQVALEKYNMFVITFVPLVRAESRLCADSLSVLQHV